VSNQRPSLAPLGRGFFDRGSRLVSEPPGSQIGATNANLEHSSFVRDHQPSARLGVGTADLLPTSNPSRGRSQASSPAPPAGLFLLRACHDAVGLPAAFAGVVTTFCGDLSGRRAHLTLQWCPHGKARFYGPLQVSPALSNRLRYCVCGFASEGQNPSLEELSPAPAGLFRAAWVGHPTQKPTARLGVESAGLACPPLIAGKPQLTDTELSPALAGGAFFWPGFETNLTAMCSIRHSPAPS
jgi:hypothetical protein